MSNRGNATVVTLEPNTKVNSVVSFEEAFGEHSNLFGKARARISSRRADNQEKIQANKQRVKTAKAATKIVKQGLKGDVKVAKVGKRSKKMVAHQGKKTLRKTLRLQRKDLATSQEPALDDTQLQDSSQQETTDGQYAEQALQNGGSDNTGYVQNDGSEISRDADSSNSSDEIAPPGYQDDNSTDQQDDDSGYAQDDETTADDSEYEDSFDAEMSSFDGNESALAPNNFFQFAGADGKKTTARMHPKVREAARKMEWNKEAASRIHSVLKDSEGSEQQSYLTDEQDEAREELLQELSKHKNRAIELQSQLDAYVDGAHDNSGAQKRVAEVNGAVREARKQRMLVRLNGQRAASMKGKPLTVIEHGLHPDVSENRIEIPAKSNLVSEHDYNLVSEHSSNLIDEHNYDSFDGKKAIATLKANKTGIIIGAVAAVLLIIGINYYTKNKVS